MGYALTSQFRDCRSQEDVLFFSFRKLPNPEGLAIGKFRLRLCLNDTDYPSNGGSVEHRECSNTESCYIIHAEELEMAIGSLKAAEAGWLLEGIDLEVARSRRDA